MQGALLLVALLAAQAAQLVEDDWDHLRPRIELAPQDVSKFIERRTGCNHFGGEVGSGDPGRENQVQDMLKKLRCNELASDERALRNAHRDKPDVLKLLDDTVDLMPW